MSLVDSKGKKLGEYAIKILTLEEGVPTIIYQDFRLAKNPKVSIYGSKEEGSPMKFPDLRVPISNGDKIPADDVTELWFESLHSIEGGSLSLEELNEVEKEIKKLKSFIDFSKENKK
jgi:hypothetical protein